VSSCALGNYEAVHGRDTVRIVVGRAEFADPHTVAVETATGPVSITAETILINTGSEPVIPDIPGLRESRRTLTSTHLLESTALPERLAILGGGYVGLEFASIYRGFGAQVSLFEKGPRILGGEDEEIAAIAFDILSDEGIDILLDAQVTEVRDGDAETTVVYEIAGDTRTIAVDAILAASGRAPVTSSLGLEAAGIHTRQARSDRGRRPPAHDPAAHLRARQRQRRAAAHVHLLRRQPDRARSAHRRRASLNGGSRRGAPDPVHHPTARERRADGEAGP
jgi:probable pyridine nucleotide-disulfide oxidoreductase